MSKSKKTSQPASAAGAAGSDRLAVLKTYKIFIGGKFPRSESGRYYTIALKASRASGRAKESAATPGANVCLSSRKDLREAVVAARSAFGGWANRSAYNRGQILYRIAEMLEGRAAQFVDELLGCGSAATRGAAQKEVERAIDCWIYYAGWCDKYTQVFGSVNPVASSHFNFSVPEPTGVVGVIAPDAHGLLGLAAEIAPAIAGGNSVVVLAGEGQALSAISFAEVLNVSDLPGGVVNILTGRRSELLEHFATHMDINAVVYSDGARDEARTRALSQERRELQHGAAGNVKRIVLRDADYARPESYESPYRILDTQEIKTTWHPVESPAGSGGGY